MSWCVGLVLFLEEDHFVAKDFLSVLSLMKHERDLHYPNCDIICLGTYLKRTTLKDGLPKDDHNKVRLRKLNYRFVLVKCTNVEYPFLTPSFCILQAVITQWISTKHNMGMAFTREVWLKIRFCASTFCKYDDYNWDWSLFHVSMTCLSEKFLVMYIKSPRVFHIGDWCEHYL